MRNTYVVKYARPYYYNNEFVTCYCTLTLVATEKNALAFLNTCVEKFEGSTLSEYLQNTRTYMEENGGCVIWQISCNGTQLEQFVNSYMFSDEWDTAAQDGNYYVTETVYI